jgi:hypothetical protein
VCGEGTHQEETSTDDPTDGDHGDMTVLELPLELALTAMADWGSLDVGILIIEALLGVGVRLLVGSGVGVGGHQRRRSVGRGGRVERENGVCKRGQNFEQLYGHSDGRLLDP